MPPGRPRNRRFRKPEPDGERAVIVRAGRGDAEPETPGPGSAMQANGHEEDGMISKLLGMAGAAALLISSGAAVAQSASSLSLGNGPAARAGAALADAGELRGSAKWILGAIALGLIIWGAIELLGDDDEAFPASP